MKMLVRADVESANTIHMSYPENHGASMVKVLRMQRPAIQGLILHRGGPMMGRVDSLIGFDHHAQRQPATSIRLPHSIRASACAALHITLQTECKG